MPFVRRPRPNPPERAGGFDVRWAPVALANGVTFADASPHGNPTFGNLPSGATGPFGRTGSFSGTDYYDAPDATHLRLPQFTLVAWVSCSNFTAYNSIIEKGTNGANRNYSMLISPGGRPYVGFTSGATYIATPNATNPVVTANRWTMLAGTYDGAGLRLYMGDDVSGWLGQVDSQATTAAPDAQANAVTVGRTATTDNGFIGQIDGVCVLGHALAEADILRFWADPWWYCRPQDSAPLLAAGAGLFQSPGPWPFFADDTLCGGFSPMGL